MAREDRGHRHWGREHGRHLALGLLAIGLLAGFAAAAYVRSNLVAAERQILDENADRIADAIDKRMSAYEAVLLSTRSLFAASEEVSRTEFRHFVASLELAERYPGILGLGYTMRLRGSLEERRDAVRRALGDRPIVLWPEAYEEAPESAILYLEPQTPRNLAALGFDMFAYPSRREAMIRARDTGMPAISGRARLIQESFSSERPGFLFYLPRYREGAPLDTVEERREALLGWVYGAFRMEDLIQGVLGGEELPWGFRIYDGPVEDPLQLLYDEHGTTAQPVEMLVYRELQLAGRTWLLVFEGPGVGPKGFWIPLTVLLGFILVSALLFAVTWLQIRRREAAEAQREELLRNEVERSRLLQQEKAAREEAERARAGARFLADASNLLASALASPSLLEELAERSIPFFGEACAIDLYDGERRLWREILATDDPDLSRVLQAFYRTRPLDSATAPTVVEAAETGRAIIRERAPASVLATLPPDLRAIGERLGAYLVAPLAARGRTFGVICFYSREMDRYDETDRQLAEDLAQRVALAMDNARLFSNAQEAIRVREEFLSIASHELRTPLTALQAQLQGLSRQIQRGGGISPEKLEERLATALRQTFRLGRLVRDLLDFNLLKEEPLDLEWEDLDLGELVRDVATRYEGEASRAGCAIHVASDEGVVGRWDRQRLDQLVAGLLSNAIKYGAGEPISVVVRSTGSTAVLEVQDRGIGISPEAQSRIFDRYERAASVRHYGGLGLGLFIVCKIVVAHGGTIGVESEPGSGALFRVELPLTKGDPMLELSP